MAATGPYWRLVGQTPRVSGSVDGKATIAAGTSAFISAAPSLPKEPKTAC